MVKVVPGQEKTVYNALQEIDGIKDVYHVFGEFDFVVGEGAVEAVVAGAGVQLGDEVAGGGEHDRVQAGGSVGLPGVEHVVGDRGQVADVDAVVVEVEAECFGVPIAEGEAGGALGGGLDVESPNTTASNRVSP